MAKVLVDSPSYTWSVKHTIFKFHDVQFWKLILGVAKGIHTAPSFANINLARRMDRLITQLGNKYGLNNKLALQIFKRYLDDIFQISTGTTKELNHFL